MPSCSCPPPVALTALRVLPLQQEAELEGLLFGRDEEALQQLGHEVGGGGADGGASLADFLSSYRVGAAAAAAREDEEDDEEAAAAEVAAGGLGLFEDRQGGDAQQQRGAQQRRRPVWEDPQDVALRIDVAQHSQLRKLRRDEAETELTGRAGDCRGYCSAGAAAVAVGSGISSSGCRRHSGAALASCATCGAAQRKRQKRQGVAWAVAGS